MKTLHQHKLLIDTECPLCRVYSGAFEACGLLEKGSVVPYGVGSTAYSNIDTARAKDEIALINTANGSVEYGVDSLAKILGHSFGLIRFLAGLVWVKAFLKRMYSFISFNRKVIVPNKESTCHPSYSLKYRVLYIIMAGMSSSYILYRYSFKLQGWVSVQGYERELFLSFGQLVFQAFFLMGRPRRQIVDYLGNLSTVSLMGALLLALVMLVGKLVPISSLGYMMCFGAVVGLIFLEHWRRIKILNLPVWLCLTWVVYRMILLLLYI